MAGAPRGASRLDYARLARYLRALANENRLAILDQLQSPRPARGLRVAPQRADGRGSPGRGISTVGVKGHLEALRKVGLVSTLPDRAAHGAQLHALNHQKLYAVVEELRALATLTGHGDLPGVDTIPGPEPGADRGRVVPGPRVVIVHGRHEGRVLPLGSRAREGRGWVIGRRPGLDIALDYDPFISGEHAEILARAGSHALLDLRTNVNGTYLNWQRLPRGGEAPLRTGDIIGAGRSLLLFRED